MNKKIIVLSLVALMFSFTAQAAEFIAPVDKTQSNVSTMEKDVHKNLYIAGASVTVNGQTLGDLVAAGGMVTVNGNVQKNLIVAGGNITINGSVGENLRVGGGNISISSPVSGDLLIGGGNISIAQKANVGGDLIVGGGNVNVDSDVKGSVKIAGGTVTINGKVSGDVEVIASKSLTFGSNSEVLGKVTYKGPQPAVINEGAKIGTIDYTEVHKKVAQTGGIIGLLIISSLFKLLMFLVSALVLCWLLPSKISAVVRQAISDPWRSLGIGVLVMIVSPILGVLLMISVVGMYLGMIVFLVYALLMILASILALFYTGNLVWGWYRKDAPVNLWRDLGIGAVVMLVLGLIPVIGWIAFLILWLITLGALITHWKKEAVKLNE
jgi:hypothetical protein